MPLSEPLWSQLSALHDLLSAPDTLANTPAFSLSGTFSDCEVRFRQSFSTATNRSTGFLEWRLSNTGDTKWKPISPDMHYGVALAILNQPHTILEKVRARRLAQDTALARILTVPLADRLTPPAPAGAPLP